MGSGSKAKKGQINMGDTPMNPGLWEAYRWCVRNQIAIAPKAFFPITATCISLPGIYSS